MAIGTLIKPTTIGWDVVCLTCDKTVTSVYSKEVTNASELDQFAEQHIALAHGKI